MQNLLNLNLHMWQIMVLMFVQVQALAELHLLKREMRWLKLVCVFVFSL